LNHLTESAAEPHGFETSTCGACRFWFRQPAHPMALGEPPPGQCRHHVLGQLMPTGPGQATIVSFYALPPANFPACSYFEAAKLEGGLS
jgi:hypothetical protein